jgi:hypothetical protein
MFLLLLIPLLCSVNLKAHLKSVNLAHTAAVNYRLISSSFYYVKLYVLCGTILLLYPLVKLQKRFAYKYKDKEYYKNIITLPYVFVEKLGWKEGTELDLHVSKDDDILVLKSKKKRNNSKS